MWQSAAFSDLVQPEHTTTGWFAGKLPTAQDSEKIQHPDRDNSMERVESFSHRLSGMGPERNSAALHAAEIAVASHRAAEIE